MSELRRTQKTIALSSCESEVYAATSGGAEGKFLKSVYEFLISKPIRLEIRSDSSSGRQWLQRSGVGRMKHYDTRLLWMQAEIKQGLIHILPLGTVKNLSDLNTKCLTAKRRKYLLYLIGCVEFKDGEYSRIGEAEFHEALVEEQMKKRISRVKSCTGGNKFQNLMYAFIISQMGTSVTGYEDSVCVPSPIFYSWMIFTGMTTLYFIWCGWLVAYSLIIRRGEVREVQTEGNVALNEIPSRVNEWYETENNSTFLCVLNPENDEVRRIPLVRQDERTEGVLEDNSGSTESEASENSGEVMYVSRELLERWHGTIPNTE